MRFIWEKLKAATLAIRRNLPAVMAGVVIVFIAWLALTMVLSQQLNRLANTARNLWSLPVIMFLLVLGWFCRVEVIPNYDKRGEKWWLGLFWVPWLGKLPPFRGRPKEQWKWHWGMISAVAFLMGGIALVVMLLSLFGVIGNLKFGS